MLPLPPLNGLQETIKFILPHVLKSTGSKYLIIKPNENSHLTGYNSAGDFFEPLESHISGNNMIYIPLKNSGWLGLNNPSNLDDQQFIAHYCFQAIENSIAYNLIQQKSALDALTGLPNRAALNEEIDNQIDKSIMFCILFMDLNNFKIINDKYGHLIGDDALRETVKELKKVVRSTDFLARYGGDEFVAVLPGSSMQKGNKVSRRVQELIIKARHGITITLSVGLSVYPLDADNSEKLIGLADVRMYENKKRRYSS